MMLNTAKLAENLMEQRDGHQHADNKAENNQDKLQQCLIQKQDLNLSTEWPVPDELMHIFPTKDRGCFRMCLSTSGQFLVAACDSAGQKASMYELRIYDLQLGTVHCIFDGHSALVYDLTWFTSSSVMSDNNNKGEELVVSCSGDGR